MSLTNIRPYFRDILDSLDFEEWTDGFNFENIPQTVLDRSYHLGPISVSGVKANQLDQETTSSISIKVHFKGFSDPSSAIDIAIEECEEIIKECVLSTNRIGLAIKNVIFETMDIDPLNQNDDNSVLVTLNFSCFVIIEKEDDC